MDGPRRWPTESGSLPAAIDVAGFFYDCAAQTSASRQSPDILICIR
jgi:hypothetical protein